MDDVLYRNDLRDDEKLSGTFNCKTDTLLLKKIKFKNTTEGDKQRCSRVTNHTRFLDSNSSLNSSLPLQRNT